MAIPKEGYFKYEQGNYGPVSPRTPACYGFSILAKVKPGREHAIRDHGKTMENAIQDDPFLLAPLKLHYLKWLLFDIGNEKYFMFEGIFDTDFDKYTYDAVTIFNQSGISTTFENLEDFPEDWRTRPEGFIKFVRDHHCPSFWNMGNIPMSVLMRLRKPSSSKRPSPKHSTRCSEYSLA